MAKVLGIKKMMSQVFDESGYVVPVTIIDLSGVCFAKMDDEKAWIGIGKAKNPTQSLQGLYKELGYVPKKVIEVELDAMTENKIGESFDLGLLEAIKRISVTGYSKGKGFAGVVKRWGFHGGPKTHGQSDRNRAPGSIGAGTTPGRVLKGKKMGGRLGNDKVTVKNLDIIKIDKENKLVMVKGAVPGPKGSVVVLNF